MKSHLFVPAVSAAGLLVVGHCISTIARQPLDPQWLALAALTLLTGSFTIKIPSVSAHLSVSEAFVFASVLLFGTSVATITVALEILIIIRAGVRTRDPLRILFNVSAAALSIWLSSMAFFAIARIEPLSQHETPLPSLILPLAFLATSYFILNSGMVAIALAIERKQSAIAIWRSNFLPLSVNYLGGASVAALFVSYTRTIDLVAFGVIVPLLIISYLTFKYSFSRIEDANQHVIEVKRLYLSTIETLATAIDAKDQVTHGHIRRVQQLALGLARKVGVKDELQLQALEAAALLHDTGKLVVPEHILNKPGKLTRGEFEKMKAHASVGADILASIKFPYPVVPIVRHHHESWDGTGYPDGLRGVDIPIGARILAVVDCFDALTSDRPYRRRMTDADALAILVQRRGVMYDPLVVDAFTINWRELCAEVEADAPVQPAPPVFSVAPALATVAAQFASASGLSPIYGLLQTAAVRTGAKLAVIFAADRDNDCLVSIAASTTDGRSDGVHSMGLGEGVSGWVAVNGTSVLNADAALDFRNSPNCGFVRSLCVPVRIGGQLAGVLSVYVDDPRGFSEEDKVTAEQLAASFDHEEPSKAFDALLGARKSSTTASHTVH